MRRFLTVLMVLAMLLTLAACGGNGGEPTPPDNTDNPADNGVPAVLRVGMECDYAPFNWTQASESDRTVPISSGGYADGYDVQVARYIAAQLGCELEIVKIEWDGLTPALTSGAIDVIIAGMSPLPERMETIDFTDPYYESELVIVVRADSDFAGATSLADFSGANITAQLNTFHDTVVEQIPEVNHVNPMETFPAMIVALRSGAIDGYISERPGAESAVEANSDLVFIELEDGFVTDPGDTAISVGVAKNSSLTTQINEVLAGLSAEQRDQMMRDALANQPLAAE